MALSPDSVQGMPAPKNSKLEAQPSVKVMLSYDYCHFEIALASDEFMTMEQIDEMRKEAQRLADKAVQQYKISKKIAEGRIYHLGEAERLTMKVEAIKQNYPQSEWTEDQKATVKAYANHLFHVNRFYDYEDDWDDDF